MSDHLEAGGTSAQQRRVRRRTPGPGTGARWLPLPSRPLPDLPGSRRRPGNPGQCGKLTRVLMATINGPSGQVPGARLTHGLTRAMQTATSRAAPPASCRTHAPGEGKPADTRRPRQEAAMPPAARAEIFTPVRRRQAVPGLTRKHEFYTRRSLPVSQQAWLLRKLEQLNPGATITTTLPGASRPAGSSLNPPALSPSPLTVISKEPPHPAPRPPAGQPVTSASPSRMFGQL